MTGLASRQQLRAALLRWLLVLVPGCILLGFASSALAGGGPGDPWFQALARPAIYPPGIAFPIVWTVLYVLMGVAAALVAVAHGAWGRGPALGAFAAQLVVNLAWAPLFFGAHRIGLAFALQLVLDALVAVCIVFFARVRPLAAWLMAPYLVWCLFATVLCWQVLSLNPWADGAAGPPAALRLRIGP